MIPLVVLMVLATFLGMCGYALHRARRGQSEALHLQRLVDEAPQTSIADAPSTGRIHVAGRVSGEGYATVTAPFTGGEAVWARATLQTNVGQIAREWIESVATIVIDDGSGRVVHVQPTAASVRLPRVSLGGAGHAARIAAYLAGRGWTPSAGHVYFEYESALRPGDTISMVGTARAPEGAYRESAATLSLSADDGELVLFDADVERKSPEALRRNAGCATFGIVFFAVAMIITALVGYAR